MQNYELLLERIASSSGLTKEEVDKRIEARRAKLSGLISKEGAGQIIAAELGVSFDNVQLKISELMPGMKKVNVVVKIVQTFPVRSYDKNGKQGKVANLIVADSSGNTRLVLWDTNHIALIESGEIKAGDVIEVKNGSMRDNEIHLSGFSDIKKSEVILDKINVEKSYNEKTIEELKEVGNARVRGLIVQMFPPRFFSVCPQCGKKAIADGEGFSCNEHGRVVPKERFLLNLILDDGTETIRTVLFSDAVEKLTSEDLKDITKFAIFKDNWLGTEVYLKGNVRKNQLFNNLELTVSDVEKVDADKLIEVLEKK